MPELNPAVTAQADDLASQFAHAEPYRHVVIDNFLDSELCASLIEQFPPFDPGSALNERGEVGRKAARSDTTALGPAYRRFDTLMRDRGFLELAGKLTGIPDLLYDPEY